jgi:hypothetical protein
VADGYSDPSYRYLDAAGLRAWVQAERGQELERLHLLDAAAERAYRRWRVSRTARIESVDRVLTALELELSHLPDSLWRRKRSGRH